MSRDQRPGKVKLVGGAAANLGRRRGDKLPRKAPVAVPPGAADKSPAARNRGGLLLSLLFLLACASGGAGSIYFGLAEVVFQ